MLRKIWLFALLCLLTAGMTACTKAVNIDPATLNFGPYPENYAEIADTYVRTIPDLYEYHLESGQPAQYLAQEMDIFDSEPNYGWAVNAVVTTYVYERPVIGYHKERDPHGKIQEKPIYGPRMHTGYKTNALRLYIRNGLVVGIDQIY